MRPQEKTVTICVERDGDGFYAYAPALKGLHVGGNTEEEVLKNIKDGIMLYLDSLSNCGEPFPEGPDLKIREYSDTLTKEISVLWPSQTAPGNKSIMSRPKELYVH